MNIGNPLQEIFLLAGHLLGVDYQDGKMARRQVVMLGLAKDGVC
jgi:hypothetical protein